jgi:phosphoglycerate dehydrogenase-like enzyme
MTDIVVLHDKIHGLDPEDYADTIREACPNREVAVAHTPQEREEYLTGASVATGFQIDPELVKKSNTLELFACTFAGTDHLPLDVLKEANVTVTNASGVHGPNVAEQVLGYILSKTRGLRQAWEQNSRNEWNHFQTGELQGSTATVVGMGPIGTEIIDRLNDFSVETIGIRYTPDKQGNADEIYGYDQTLNAATRSDYLILACPLTETTDKLIDNQVFNCLPTDAMLINVARGPVVDTDALVSALRGNDIQGAALDVTDPEPLPSQHPLWSLKDCLITPHNAGHTPKYWERCTDILIKALD